MAHPLSSSIAIASAINAGKLLDDVPRCLATWLSDALRNEAAALEKAVIRVRCEKEYGWIDQVYTACASARRKRKHDGEPDKSPAAALLSRVYFAIENRALTVIRNTLHHHGRTVGALIDL
jgi:hypothetical protein